MPSFRRWCRAGLLLGAVLALGACERPFVEVIPPGLRVVSPDLSTVRTEPTLILRVAASSFRPVEQVTLNGFAMTFDRSDDAWVDTLQLERGLNRLVLTAVDADDVFSRDTTYAVYLPFRFMLNAPPLPVPLGGHTATLLSDGRLLVVGGASLSNGPAVPDAYVRPSGGLRFDPLGARLNEARTGHTATLLPDGRVLILGGSRTETLTTVSQLVETPEAFNPATGRFETIPFRGQPIRRAYHTASLRTGPEGLLVDLYGGRGDVRYEPDSRLGTRRDLRTFLVTSDSLIALNTLRSAPFLDDAIAGHTQSALSPLVPGSAGRYLILGSYFDDQATDDVSFILDFTDPLTFRVSEAPPPLTPRTRHAAATIVGDLLVFLGGRQGSPSSALSNTEFYSETAARFFHLPQPEGSVRRYGHTATNLSSRRILILGGFGTDGTAFTASEFFDTSLSN